MPVCTHLCVPPQGELQVNKQQLEEAKQRVDGQKAEQQKLQKIIADADAEQIQQKKQLEQVKKEIDEKRGPGKDSDRLVSHYLLVKFVKVIRERDNLGKQLLRRNDERALLYEKIRIQQSILSKGDFHYNQRMEDIRLLKLEIKRLRRKKSILDKTVPNTEELRYTLKTDSLGRIKRREENSE